MKRKLLWILLGAAGAGNAAANLDRGDRGLFVAMGADGESAPGSGQRPGAGRMDAAAEEPNIARPCGGAAGQSGFFCHVLEFRCNHGGNPFGAVRACGPSCLGADQASAAQGPGQSLYGADAAALSGAHVSGIPGTALSWPAGYPLGGDFARNFLCLPRLPAYKVLCGNSGGNSGGGTAGRGRGNGRFFSTLPCLWGCRAC